MNARNKYRNVKTVVDGITFDSKKEAKRYGELKLLEKAGEITDLELQPEYPLNVNGKTVAKYRGDFRYFDRRNGVVVHEDVKGVQTPVFRLKKKILAAQNPPINVTVV